MEQTKICSRCKKSFVGWGNYYTDAKTYEVKVLCVPCQQAVLSGKPWELESKIN